MVPIHKTIVKKISVEATYTAELNRQELINILNAAGVLVPDDVEISVVCPSGGDWSGDNLILGQEIQAIHLTWQRHAERIE